MDLFLTSESIANIAKALAAFQSKVLHAKKDSKNKHFNNEYPSITSVLDAVLPTLGTHGLAVSQFPIGGNGLLTLLMHESGEWIKCLMTQDIKDPTDVQKRMGSITYMRRYALTSLLGIGDADDDGAKANEAGAIKKIEAKKEVPAEIKEPKDGPYDNANPEHKIYICKLMMDAGIEDSAIMVDIASKLIGRPFSFCKEMIMQKAGKM